MPAQKYYVYLQKKWNGTRCEIFTHCRVSGKWMLMAKASDPIELLSYKKAYRALMIGANAPQLSIASASEMETFLTHLPRRKSDLYDRSASLRTFLVYAPEEGGAE